MELEVVSGMRHNNIAHLDAEQRIAGNFYTVPEKKYDQAVIIS